MSLQNISKSAVRVGKNYIKGYSDVQVKVRDATSNDPWGPSGTQMNELAQLSYNQYVSVSSTLTFIFSFTPRSQNTDADFCPPAYCL